MGARDIMELSELLARRALPQGPSSPLASTNWHRFSPQDVRGAFDILVEHRLHLLVFARLTEEEKRHHLPRELDEELSSTLRKTSNHQGLLEMAFAQVTHALHARGLPPIACKGIVLAREYYRPKGVRPMQDIDLWVPHAAIAQVREALQSVGFKERPDKETNHALYFENQWGLLLDVHHHMALFERQGLDPFELTVAPQSGWHRVFRPEALLIHLVYHLLGHTSQVGILLGWVLDISVVLNKHDIDWAETRRLCPSPRVWKILMRLIALADDLGWSPIPAALEPELEGVVKVRFATLVRLRHLAPLGLTRPRGWARLVKRLGVKGLGVKGLGLKGLGLKGLDGSDAVGPPIPALSELPLGLKELFVEGTRFGRADCALLTGEESNRHS